MTESIQTQCAVLSDRDEGRIDFIRRAADLYGRRPAVDVAEVAGHDDTAALLLAFPWFSDAELLEALWALDEGRQRPSS